jgi:hypothetical protein
MSPPFTILSPLISPIITEEDEDDELEIGLALDDDELTPEDDDED